PGMPFGAAAKPDSPRFPSWQALPDPTQAQIPGISGLTSLSGPYPSPDSRHSGPGKPFRPPPKPVFPAFPSWLASPAPIQARFPGIPVLAGSPGPRPSPYSRHSRPGKTFRTDTGATVRKEFLFLSKVFSFLKAEILAEPYL
ncbi:MAG: hypothetical protein ACOX5T_09180, partial [Candidatus Cryptobacteroides sp.]